MNEEYNAEYVEVIDELLMRYISDIECINPTLIQINGKSIASSIRYAIWPIIFSRYKEFYNKNRNAGKAAAQIKVEIWNKTFPLIYPEATDKSKMLRRSIKTSPFYDALAGFRSYVCFYCYNKRQLDYFAPFLRLVKEPTLVFVDFNVDDGELDNENVTILHYELYLPEPHFQNTFLKRRFPYLFLFGNVFLDLFTILSPRCIILLEGCHAEMEMIASVAKVKNIQSLCIQRGWPSVMYSRFRNMSYDYFLTWGEKFSILWQEYNPAPKFISIGYPYLVEKHKDSVKAVTFFLQGPVGIMNIIHFDSLLYFALDCAKLFPNQNFWIREHPDFRINDTWKEKLGTVSNIHFVSKTPLSEVYRNTLISVSIFSSTLMESIVHNSIPFIYNITSFAYNPNILEEEMLGVIANNHNEAISKMKELLNCYEKQRSILESISTKKADYFTAVSDVAVKNFMAILEKY